MCGLKHQKNKSHPPSSARRAEKVSALCITRFSEDRTVRCMAEGRLRYTVGQAVVIDGGLTTPRF